MDLHISLLARLRAFEAVARYKSFKHAADELHVTQSALSHHVRKLEDDLGLRLLVRLHRRIELTEAGRQLCIDCADGFETLRGALRRLRRRGPTNTLTVNVAPYFSARWLIPRLGRLWTRYPQINLQLHHAYQPADFLHDHVDACISWGDGHWPEIEAKLVLAGDLTPVCSPTFLRNLTRPPIAGDLVACRLFYEFDEAHWRAWLVQAGVSCDSPLNATRIDDSHALRRAALDGHGVALFFSGLIEEDLRSGQLIAPFKQTVDPGSAYYLVRPRRRPANREFVLFARWLTEEIATQPCA